MALLRGKGGEIPSDAIVLSEEEALSYQVKILKKWKNGSETFFFRNGGGILAVASAASGFYINNYFRRKFKLRTIAQISTYLPIVVLPAALSFVVHIQFVLPSVVLQKSCPICIEMRSAAYQSCVGCLIPIGLAPLSALSLSVQYNTIPNLPYVTKQPMEVLNIVRKMIRPAGNLFFGMFIAHALLGSVITYLEEKSVLTVNQKLAELEKKLEYEEMQSVK